MEEINNAIEVLKRERKSTTNDICGLDDNVNISGETEDYKQGSLAGIEKALLEIDIKFS